MDVQRKLSKHPKWSDRATLHAGLWNSTNGRSVVTRVDVKRNVSWRERRVERCPRQWMVIADTSGETGPHLREQTMLQMEGRFQLERIVMSASLSVYWLKAQRNETRLCMRCQERKMKRGALGLKKKWI